jgi:glycine cleavage system H protein
VVYLELQLKIKEGLMKELNELSFPEDVRYAESHEWVNVSGDTAKIGITDYAQDQLGDIVFVELPDVGESFDKGSEFGTVESVKAVSELYMPVGGEIVAINEALDDAPELINNTPFSDGWMIEVKLENPSEVDTLLDKDAYLSTLKG